MDAKFLNKDINQNMFPDEILAELRRWMHDTRTDESRAKALFAELDNMACSGQLPEAWEFWADAR